MGENVTVLGGALERRGPDDCAWTDTGEPEPRVRDMKLIDLAPNYRVVKFGDGSHFVEVPMGWGAEVTDPDVMEVLVRLVVRYGEPATIFVERPARRPNHRRSPYNGWRVPLEEWDREMGRVVGVWWDKPDEPAVLERAARARGERGEQGG